MRQLRRRVAFVVVLLFIACLAAPQCAAAGALPWGQALARGRELPAPLGIGVTLYTQNQKYTVDSISFVLPGIPAIDAAKLGIDNRLEELNAQFDVWLLPFLNVIAIVGAIDGQTQVDFSALGLPLPLPGVTVSYDGIVYGGGLTLAAGGERWFSSLTAIQTTADLSGDFDSSVKTLVVMPRVGIGGRRASAWVGAMYQKADEHHSGQIDLPYLGTVPFALQLSEKSPWSGLIGMRGELSPHWTLELEGGFGSRLNASATVAYRF